MNTPGMHGLQVPPTICLLVAGMASAAWLVPPNYYTSRLDM